MGLLGVKGFGSEKSWGCKILGLKSLEARIVLGVKNSGLKSLWNETARVNSLELNHIELSHHVAQINKIKIYQSLG